MLPAREGRGAPLRVHLDPGDWEEVACGFWAGARPAAFRHARPDGNDPAVEATPDGERIHYRYADGTEFLIDLRESRVWGRTAPGLTRDDTIVYLLGPVLGFIARCRGTLCLHASAVIIDGGAVVFAGPGGAGKSTLAAAFATAGATVVTDDIAAIVSSRERHAVEPGNAFLRLWPSSAPVTAEAAELPRLAPDWEKRFVDLTRPPYSFARSAVPLDSIYVLEDACGRPPAAGPLAESEALVALVGNTYANYMLTPDQRAGELRALGKLVARVPVRSLSVPDDLDALPRVRDAVIEDVRARPATGPSSSAVPA